jgi:hypothetical protein
MEQVDYTGALLWYALWPIVIYLGYRFTKLNIEHLEENIEKREK